MNIIYIDLLEYQSYMDLTFSNLKFGKYLSTKIGNIIISHDTTATINLQEFNVKNI